MKRICLKNECIGCLNCYNLCKSSAIKLEKDELGFVYAQIDEGRCIGCNICKDKCPILLEQSQDILINECYACKNIDEEIRMKSSSGGVFYLLAKYIISKNGIVYGAAFDREFNVIHKKIDKIENIVELMGSKYVQSNLGNIYYEIKLELENKVMVLFTGTPCQVAALKSYLGKEYTNLYVQDFACHGVGSKKVLDKHISELELSNKLENITRINFRDKISGWKNFSLSILADKGSYIKDLSKDNFMKAFLKNLCLRQSCYNCKYKGDNRMSDITLADFWGIDNDFDDDKGVSAVIINTTKGKELFESIKDELVLKKVKYKDISENNICLEKSAIYNKHREDFIREVNTQMELSNIKEEYYKR